MRTRLNAAMIDREARPWLGKSMVAGLTRRQLELASRLNGNQVLFQRHPVELGLLLPLPRKSVILVSRRVLEVIFSGIRRPR